MAMKFPMISLSVFYYTLPMVLFISFKIYKNKYLLITMNELDEEIMKIEDFNHTIYYEDSEFAPIRKEILKEKQWLRNNYTEENLIIENQVGFSVVWHKSGSLFAAGGLYELNPYLGRHL